LPLLEEAGNGLIVEIPRQAVRTQEEEIVFLEFRFVDFGTECFHASADNVRE
jgi:hypothetical protein